MSSAGRPVATFVGQFDAMDDVDDIEVQLPFLGAGLPPWSRKLLLALAAVLFVVAVSLACA